MMDAREAAGVAGARAPPVPGWLAGLLAAGWLCQQVLPTMAIITKTVG